MLLMRSLHSATVLDSNSYYTVVASIFLASTASCKAICGVALIRTSDMLIKYAHVLICIWAGEGSQHFSAFHLEVQISKLINNNSSELYHLKQ